MKLDKIAKYSLLATMIGSLNGIAYGAESNLVIPGVTDQNNAQTVSSPQIDAAVKRIETAKTNLDLARKRLDASKSLLKAAEAELRAARTDKDALVLNTQAQKLADASGLPKNGENAPVAPIAPVVTPSTATATPNTGAVYNNNESTIDYSGGTAAGQVSSAPAPTAQ